MHNRITIHTCECKHFRLASPFMLQSPLLFCKQWQNVWVCSWSGIRMQQRWHFYALFTKNKRITFESNKRLLRRRGSSEIYLPEAIVFETVKLVTTTVGCHNWTTILDSLSVLNGVHNVLFRTHSSRTSYVAWGSVVFAYNFFVHPFRIHDSLCHHLLSPLIRTLLFSCQLTSFRATGSKWLHRNAFMHCASDSSLRWKVVGSCPSSVHPRSKLMTT